MHSRLTRSFTVFLVLIFLLIPVSAALADYLGPDRVRTETREVCKVVLLECQYVADKGDYRYHQVEDWLCSNEAKPWLAYPDAPSLLGCFEATQGQQYWEKQYAAQTTTVAYPEAEISGALQNCSAQNGWCSTAPSLALSASEPVAGYAITLIEGSRNGEPFACNGDSCQIPLLEGENNLTFWALSTWGDSSRMGNLTARVDTQPPLVNGEISGTPGENGWYVSEVTVSAFASDPQPGSGIQALTYTLGGAWQPYTAPLTLNDGVHNVTFRAADRAGHTSEANASVQVDTQPPQVNASLAGEQVNGWYLSQVTLFASADDPSTGSGLARLEYAPDGGAWQSYAAPVTFGDGQHSVQVRAFDLAGNVSAPASLAFRVDGTAPRIQLTDAWYIWESGALRVNDDQSGLGSVEIQIRDGQGRWQPVTRAYQAEGGSFSTSISWDRTFADGTTAPVGEYDVVITARDLAGNESRETARILIPAPGITPTPLPTRTPLPTLTTVPQSSFIIPNSSLILPTATLKVEPPGRASRDPVETRAAVTSAFQSSTRQAPITTYQSTNPPSASSSAPLFGAAAITAIAAATGLVIAAKRRREEEERAQAERVRAEAEAKTAALRAKEAQQREQAKIQNYLQSKAALEAMLQNPALSEAEKARIREEAKTKGLASAFTLAQTAAAEAAARQQAYQDYRAGEHNAEAIVKDYQAQKALQDYRAGERSAEAIAAEYQTRKAVPEYRQGERAEYVTPLPVCTAENIAKPKPWWQRAGEWVQQKIVQPVQQAVPKVMNWVDQHQTEIVIGIGIAAGVAAVILSGGAATPLVAAAWVAGSAAVASGVAALGTVGLNAYFHRPLTTNLWHNLGYAAGAAAVTATAGFVLQAVAPTVTRAAAQFCLGHVTTCSVAAPVFKGIDYAWTGYDVWQSQRTLNNPRSGTDEKLLAAVNIGLAAWSESLEPDDALAIGLPLDDVVRKELMAKFAEILEREGKDAAFDYLRRVLGDEKAVLVMAEAASHADEVEDALRLAGYMGDELHSLVTASRLRQVGAHSDEGRRLIEALADQSTRGSGSRVVIGKWIEGGGYIAEAQKHGGIYYETASGVWDALGKNDDLAWAVNEQFLRNQLENGIDRIDLVGESIDDILEKGVGSFRWREVNWLLDNAPKYGYELVGNSWVKVVP